MWKRLEPLAMWLGTASAACTIAYWWLMFDWEISERAVIESRNFAAQTITTVGYGNWVPRSVADDDVRVLAVKAVSIPFMLTGAVLFSLTIGVWANVISEQRNRGTRTRT